VRAIGASNLDAEATREALDVSRERGLPRYETLQPHYNLLVRDEFEGPLQALLRARGTRRHPVLLARRGLPDRQVPLRGRLREERARSRACKKYLNARGATVLAALEYGRRRDSARRMAQVALAWLMAQPASPAPIASATSVAQLDELMGRAARARRGVLADAGRRALRRVTRLLVAQRVDRRERAALRAG
jgi:aryl-alcohol dehydrogenase-like predicted oxidoreductase